MSKKIIPVLIVFMAGIIIYLLFSKVKEDIVFIDSTKIFTGFSMTKEINQAGNIELENKKRTIDSLYAALETSPNGIFKENIMKKIISKKTEIESFNNEFTSNESPKIWKRIKNYGRDFSEENGYMMIIGAHPNSNIIYGKESIDVTDEFLKFINKKYEGIK